MSHFLSGAFLAIIPFRPEVLLGSGMVKDCVRGVGFCDSPLKPHHNSLLTDIRYVSCLHASARPPPVVSEVSRLAVLIAPFRSIQLSRFVFNLSYSFWWP